MANRYFSKTVAVVGVTLFMMLTFFANTELAFAEKIGGVDLQKVLINSKKAKKAQKELQLKFDSSKSKLEKMKAELLKMQSELTESRRTLSSDKLVLKEGQLKRKERELALEQEDLQSSLRSTQAEKMKVIFGEISSVIKDYAKKHKYHIILEKGATPSIGNPVILYLDDSIDVTDDIIKLLDQK
ncbi:MAG: OmpH family outer membrane protein [Nitrospinota bacterium]